MAKITIINLCEKIRNTEITINMMCRSSRHSEKQKKKIKTKSKVQKNINNSHPAGVRRGPLPTAAQTAKEKKKTKEQLD